MARTLVAVATFVVVAGSAAAEPVPSGYTVAFVGVTWGPGATCPTGLTYDPATSLLSLDPWTGPRPADPHWQDMHSDVVYTGGQYDLELRITDRASGQLGVVDVAGTLSFVWDHRWDGGWYPDGIGFLPGIVGPPHLTLGATDYSAQIVPRGDAGPDVLSTSVVVSNTPEPGTLALAAVGLLPVAGLARRKPVRV